MADYPPRGPPMQGSPLASFVRTASAPPPPMPQGHAMGMQSLQYRSTGVPMQPFMGDASHMGPVGYFPMVAAPGSPGAPFLVPTYAMHGMSPAPLPAAAMSMSPMGMMMQPAPVVQSPAVPSPVAPVSAVAASPATANSAAVSLKERIAARVGVAHTPVAASPAPVAATPEVVAAATPVAAPEPTPVAAAPAEATSTPSGGINLRDKIRDRLAGSNASASPAPAPAPATTTPVAAAPEPAPVAAAAVATPVSEASTPAAATPAPAAAAAAESAPAPAAIEVDTVSNLTNEFERVRFDGAPSTPAGEAATTSWRAAPPERPPVKKVKYTVRALLEVMDMLSADQLAKIKSVVPGMKLSKLAVRERPRAGAGAVDPVEEMERALMALCNKLSRENFEVIMEQILKLEINTQSKLQRVAEVIFEKALIDEFFQDLYADLCEKLAKKAESWTNSCMQVQFYEEHATGKGWYFAASKGADAEWVGPFETEDAATKRVKSLLSFKALLLSRAQKEFDKGNQAKSMMNQLAALEANRVADAATWTREQQDAYLQTRAEYELRRDQLLKRTASNVKFVGQLFRANMIMPNVLRFVINNLLKPQANEVPDLDFLAAVCDLFMIVGGRMDNPASTLQPDLESWMGQLIRYSNDRRVPSRQQFACMDVIELRNKGWVLTGARAALDRQQKTLTRAQLREAEERQRQQKTAMPARGGPVGTRTVVSSMASMSSSNRPTIMMPNARGPAEAAAGSVTGPRGIHVAASAPAAPAAAAAAAAAPAPLAAMDAAELSSHLEDAVKLFYSEKNDATFTADLAKTSASSGVTSVLMNNVVDLLMKRLNSETAAASNKAVLLAIQAGAVAADQLNACVVPLFARVFVESNFTDMPRLPEFLALTFTPCVASKMLTLATLSKAVASSKGAGRGAIFLASLIADLIKVGGDAAALARSERVALSHVCAGGRNNLKHAVDMLPSDLVTERYAGLAAVAQLASMVEDVCMGGDVAPLREAVASVSEDVKKGTDFARAFLLEVVAAANQYALGDSAMYKESFGHLADMTFQFVDAARSQAGVDAAAFGVSMLNGMQLTLASDDALDPRTYVDAVECLLTPARGAWIVAPADVRAWAGESGDKVVPGRADAVSAVAELVASLA